MIFFLPEDARSCNFIVTGSVSSIPPYTHEEQNQWMWRGEKAPQADAQSITLWPLGQSRNELNRRNIPLLHWAITRSSKISLGHKNIWDGCDSSSGRVLYIGFVGHKFLTRPFLLKLALIFGIFKC